jgi:hypothetical protein
VLQFAIAVETNRIFSSNNKFENKKKLKGIQFEKLMFFPFEFSVGGLSIKRVIQSVKKPVT